MKILKESKEKIPAEFITSFVSKGWEEVGALKAEISAIEKEFTDTKKIVELLNGLLDAYLVAIGGFQGYLENKDLVTIPTEEEVKESLTEKLNEDVAINIETVNVVKPAVTSEIDLSDLVADDEFDIAPITRAAQPQACVADEPNYICDFDSVDDVDTDGSIADARQFLANNFR